MCVFLRGWGERRMGGCWISAGPLRFSLTDRISERALQRLWAAWGTAAEWSLSISHWNQRERGKHREKLIWGLWLKCFWKWIMLAYVHSYIDRGISVCVCVYVCVLGWVCVYNLAFFLAWWISWWMIFSHSHSLHGEPQSSTTHNMNYTSFHSCVGFCTCISTCPHNIHHIEPASCFSMCMRSTARQCVYCLFYNIVVLSRGIHTVGSVSHDNCLQEIYCISSVHSVVQTLFFFCVIALIDLTVSMKM